MDELKVKIEIGTDRMEGYRDIDIMIVTDICDVCMNVAQCCSIDTSNGEYGPGLICRDCLDNAFEEFERKAVASLSATGIPRRVRTVRAEP